MSRVWFDPRRAASLMTDSTEPALVPAATLPKSPPTSIPRLIVVLACAGFGSTFALRSVEPLVGVLARDLASDAHTVALLSTAFALPYAFIQPVLGPIGDALGKERVMSTCLAVLAVALTLCSIAPDIGSLFGLRMLAGAAAGAAFRCPWRCWVTGCRWRAVRWRSAGSWWR